MKYKFILLNLFILLLCCGCSVEYNLDIDDDLNLNESISIDAYSNNEVNEIRSYSSFLPISYYADDYSVFEKKKDGLDYYDIFKNSDFNNIVFDYKYNVDKFNDNVFARTCYEYVTVMDTYNELENRNELIISTSKKFLYFDIRDELESVTIKIHTKREVYDHNADSVDNDTYIWNINKNNKNDAAIIMKLSSEIIAKNIPVWERSLLGIICLGIFILVFIVYIIMKNRSRKVDKI